MLFSSRPLLPVLLLSLATPRAIADGIVWCMLFLSFLFVRPDSLEVRFRDRKVHNLLFFLLCSFVCYFPSLGEDVLLFFVPLKYFSRSSSSLEMEYR